MTPIEKQTQIEAGKNWIINFWSVRGYEIVKTALGINYTLHRKDSKYDCLGLSLEYLEQFAVESVKRRKEVIEMEKINQKEMNEFLHKESEK